MSDRYGSPYPSYHRLKIIDWVNPLMCKNRASQMGATLLAFLFFMLTPIIVLPALAQDAASSDRARVECALHVSGFVSELDRVLESGRSVVPVQHLFKKYFPLRRCDADEVLRLCRQSRYFSDSERQPDRVVIFFDARRWYEHSGIVVQFSIDRRSGNSGLPFALIRL